MSTYTIKEEIEAGESYSAYLVENSQGDEYYMRKYNIPKASEIHLLSDWKEMFADMIEDVSCSSNFYLRTVVSGGFDPEDKKPYAVFEALPNKTLSSIKEEIDSLGEGNSLKICQSVLKALASLRERGLVHSLVSPDTIVHRGADSGSAWVLDWDPIRSFFCKFHVAKQIFNNFSAPEIEGGVRPTVRSDIYSVGKILEYCMGKSQLNSDLRDWVNSATSMSPANRYRNPKYALDLLCADEVQRTPKQVELREQPDSQVEETDGENSPKTLIPEEEVNLHTGNLRKENVMRSLLLKAKTRIGKGPKV